MQGHCCLTCLHLCNSPVLHLVWPVSTGVMAQFSQLFDLSLSELWSSSPSYVACLYLSNEPVLPAMWPVSISYGPVLQFSAMWPICLWVMVQFAMLCDLSVSEVWSSSPSYLTCLYLSHGPVFPAKWPVSISYGPLLHVGRLVTIWIMVCLYLSNDQVMIKFSMFCDQFLYELWSSSHLINGKMLPVVWPVSI